MTNFSIEAKTDIEDGQYLDIADDFSSATVSDPDLIDVGPPPVGLNFELSLAANEQENGDNAVTVTGLHSALLLEITVGTTPFLTLTVDGLRDQSHCDIHSVWSSRHWSSSRSSPAESKAGVLTP